MRLALYQPDIPQNLGAVLRIAACLGAAVDIIEPCGFLLTEKSLRRAAMDYASRVEVVQHPGWDAFLAAPPRGAGQLILVETDADTSLYEFAFGAHDTLLFGRESAGSPACAYAAAAHTLHIPMAPGARSLNVAVCAGIALAEARRQLALRFPNPPPGS